MIERIGGVRKDDVPLVIVHGGPGPDHSANWTAGLAQGTTVITLSDATSLTVGANLFLDQLDATVDGYPAAGDIYSCGGSTNGCSNQGPGGGWRRTGRFGNATATLTLPHKKPVRVEIGFIQTGSSWLITFLEPTS